MCKKISDFEPLLPSARFELNIIDHSCTIDILGSVWENNIEIFCGWMIEINVGDTHSEEERSSFSIEILWLDLFKEGGFRSDGSLLESGEEGTRKDCDEDYYESNWN